MYKILRKFLFLFDLDTIHNLIVFLLKIPFIIRLLVWVYRFGHSSLRR